jgi:4-hydroxy-3-methylbut-2-enyl diphosphate reductase
VIGSPKSANSNRLWEIAGSINKKSYFVRKAKDLKKEWFAGCQKVGVTAGASTPSWIIDEVIMALKSY